MCKINKRENIFKSIVEENKKRDLLIKTGDGKKEIEAIDKKIDALVERFIDEVEKG